jgi:hypothetical protein
LPGSGRSTPRIVALTAATLLGLAPARAVDFHVTTAQELQNALTLAAANGADDNIYLAAGYYTGNFNFNSAENRALLLQGETGTTNTQISIDGAGTGRDMNLANTGTGNFTVRGITFMRNTGDSGSGALRIAGGTASTLLVDSCRFLFPTNGGAIGIGLEIVSGQNAAVTNCMAIGRMSSGARGIQIQGVSGSITVGGCIVATNNGTGLVISGGGSVTVVANNFSANVSSGISASGSGTLAFLNNTVVGNSEGVGADLRASTTATAAGNIFRENRSGGYAGGGCNISAATTILSNNIFAGNVGGGDGAGSNGPGGASVGGSSLIVVNTFSGNSGPRGAGLLCGGPATIIGNVFVGNSGLRSVYGGGGNGGGLLCSSTATITGNVFTANSAVGSGGGLYCSASSTVSGNTFVGNAAAATAAGGAYFSMSSGSAVISANVFKQNAGGGVYVTAPTVTLVDNLVVKSTQGSGIFVTPASTLTMINNTVSDNTTTGNGGGLACSVSGVTEVLNVYNNIIWGNSASGNGADVWLAGTGSKKTFLYNDVHGMYGVWDIAANLLDVAPAFFDPVNGDYHLRSTSPCINAGTNGAPSLPAFDLDGYARTNGTSVDLGCYEFNNTRYHPADVNQDWVISATEYTNYANAWKNNQAWSSSPNPIPADYVTRAGFLQSQGGTYHNDGAGAPLNWKPGAN